MNYKKFPKLKELQIQDKVIKKQNQSWQQQYAIASAWAYRKKKK